MKKIIAILIAIVMCAFSAPMVGAGDSDTILVTMNPLATVNISVNPDFWSPVCGLGESNATATDAFVLTNEDGGLMVDVTINASDSAGWALGSSSDFNQFQLQYGTGEAGDPDITIGGAVIAHESYGSSGNAITKMSRINETDFIIAYARAGQTAYVRVGRYVGSSISWVTSAEQVFTHFSPYVDVAMLNATDFVVFAEEEGQSALARMGRINGSSISWLSSSSSASGGITSYNRIEKINETHFVVTWVDLNKVHFRIGYIHQESPYISWYSTVEVPTGGGESATQPSIAVLDDTYFALAFVNQSDSNRPHVVIGNIQTNSLVGSSVEVNNLASLDVDVVRVNSTDFLILYTQSGSNRVKVGRYSDGSLSLGSESDAIGNTACSEVSIDMVSDSRFVAGLDQGVTFWVAGDIDDMSVTLGEVLTTPQVNAPSVSVVGLTPTTFVGAGQALNTENIVVYPGSLLGGGGWTDIGTSPMSFVNDFLTTKEFGLQLFMPTYSNTTDIQYTTITFEASVVGGD